MTIISDKETELKIKIHTVFWYRTTQELVLSP
jgi:hypothetical protein